MKKLALIVFIAMLGYNVSKAQNSPGEEKVYSFVSLENPPKFPGGMANFYKFLAQNIKYPEQAKKANIEGKVFISFVIEKDGAVSNVKTERGLGSGTDEEAERVLKLSPNWIPGTQNEKPVRVKYNLPINFNNTRK